MGAALWIIAIVPPLESDVSPVEVVQGLFLRHFSLIRGFILGLLPDPVRADDVLQETFLTLTRKAADFDPASSFPKWACAVARYKVLEERRAMGRAGGLLGEQVIEALAVTEEAWNPDPRLERLERCIARLPEGMRRMLRLRYQEDHSPAEIAERTGWSANAVYVALSRTRLTLRKCLESETATP